MREELNRLCSQFIRNRDMVKSTFGWENTYMYPVSAAIFTDKRMDAEADKLLWCRDILKENTGIFSNFRSTAKLAIISMMATDTDPENRLMKTIEVYNRLKEHFLSSDYLTLTSLVIADLVAVDQYAEMASRTRKIYNLMKSEHPFLTSGEDSVFAALLGLSSLSEMQIVAETEQCYRLLKQEFFSGNAVQSLSHVLALCDGIAEAKCNRAVQLYLQLKERGYKYGTDHELATLGVLAMLPVEPYQVLQDIMDADDYLAQQKGYGFFGIGRKQRLMHAGMIVASSYIEQEQSHAMNFAAISGTISLIAAQQAAMCAAIAASSAAG